MAGRKPLPTRLKLIRGNPGKRPLNEREPEPKLATPTCPQILQGESRKEWRRATRELRALGLLARIDRAALAAYCRTWGRWVEAEEKIAATGEIVKAPSGYPIQNPYLSISNRALENMHRFLTEFGMTPSSRSRLRVGSREPTRDPMEELLFGAK